MAIPGTGTSAFGGVTFWYVSTGGTLRGRGKVAVYDRKKIPYGSNAVIQSAGTDVPPTQITALVNDSNYASLEALVGTSRTLALNGNSNISAYLASCVDQQKYRDGCSTVQLTFEY